MVDNLATSPVSVSSPVQLVHVSHVDGSQVQQIFAVCQADAMDQKSLPKIPQSFGLLWSPLVSFGLLWSFDFVAISSFISFGFVTAS